MKSPSIVKLSTAIALSLCASPALAGGDPWSYGGTTGPEQWGSLSPDYVTCGMGQYQSPIDLHNGYEVDLGAVDLDIKPSMLRFGLDGPTFSVPYDSGSMIEVNRTVYELQQFHFHHPSEHTVDGKHFPMEAHLVLKSVGSDHANAVLGVFFEEGGENGMLAQFWNQLPRHEIRQPEAVPVNVGELLPDNTAHWMYEGSMTTPGCRQGVRWFVLEQPVQASKAQIERFIDDFTEGKTNNRPIQPANERAILKGK